MSIDNFLLFYYNTHYSQIYINLHYKKGVSMQYIQQLLSRINILYLCPFVQKILHLSLILCLVALTPMSAYAAGDSLTSSISLSFNSTKKFQLEAYEHFYAYYKIYRRMTGPGKNLYNLILIRYLINLLFYNTNWFSYYITTIF